MAHTEQGQTGKNPGYIFKRDHRSSTRLNLNHWLLNETTGYLLHPSINYNKDNVCVADVAAGTCVWSLALSRQLPSTAAIDAFDVAPEQFPPVSWRRNVKTHVQDAFKPFPAEFLGKYDVVHVRFMLLLINNEQAEPLVRNLTTLLKPGGYLQWFEIDAPNVTLVNDSTLPSTPALDQTVKSFHKPRPDSTYDWIAKVPEIFEKFGLRFIKREEHRLDKSLLPQWNFGMLMAMEEVVEGSAVSLTQGAEATSKGLPKVLEEIDFEMRQGCSTDVPFICWLAQKSQ